MQILQHVNTTPFKYYSLSNFYKTENYQIYGYVRVDKIHKYLHNVSRILLPIFKFELVIFFTILRSGFWH